MWWFWCSVLLWCTSYSITQRASLALVSLMASLEWRSRTQKISPATNNGVYFIEHDACVVYKVCYSTPWWTGTWDNWNYTVCWLNITINQSTILPSNKQKILNPFRVTNSQTDSYLPSYRISQDTWIISWWLWSGVLSRCSFVIFRKIVPNRIFSKHLNKTNTIVSITPFAIRWAKFHFPSSNITEVDFFDYVIVLQLTCSASSERHLPIYRFSFKQHLLRRKIWQRESWP